MRALGLETHQDVAKLPHSAAIAERLSAAEKELAELQVERHNLALAASFDLDPKAQKRQAELLKEVARLTAATDDLRHMQDRAQTEEAQRRGQEAQRKAAELVEAEKLSYSGIVDAGGDIDDLFQQLASRLTAFQQLINTHNSTFLSVMSSQRTAALSRVSGGRTASGMGHTSKGLARALQFAGVDAFIQLEGKESHAHARCLREQLAGRD